jgi:predicted Rossmann fold flavoprotein
VGLFGSIHLHTGMPLTTIAISGAGAAGYFAALRLAELRPDARIVLLEKGTHPLAKVKISGGGRCNVTHACFEPRLLVEHYPRGQKEMLGPFHKFQPADVFDWFEKRQVLLKTEEDGRVFPVTDSSQTIIDCFEKERLQRGIQLRLSCGLQSMHAAGEGWELQLTNGDHLHADALLVATGSSPMMWKLLQETGLHMISPVPSLFTFNIRDRRIQHLPGVSAPHASIHIEGTDYEADGPLLVTHWGMSGPAILRLSAWAARDLARVNYDFTIRVNWDTRFDTESILDFLKEWKQEHARTQVKTYSAARIPHRLWLSLIETQPGLAELKWADVSALQLEKLGEALVSSYFAVQGKSTFKDEFVTAGGVDLKEVDFRTMAAKRFPGLYLAGEVLDIDAITGGFNFQAAWTTAWIAAQAMADTVGKNTM